MIIRIDGVDVTAWLDRDAGLRPGREELLNPIRTYELTLVEVRTTADVIPIVPLYGRTFDVYDETPMLVFSGRISTATLLPLTGARAWQVGAQGWAVRLFETATDALDLSASVDTDRQHVIAILSSGLAGDPIYTANAPTWPGIQATGAASGHDYSYKQTYTALQTLMRDMPGVSIQIRPDLIVEYGTAGTPAPIALCTFAAPSADFREVLDQSYNEQEIVGDHRNRLHLGGFGAAEVTAVDLSSVARFGRYMDAPFADDENIPAADLERLAYARLAALRVRRRTSAAVIDATGCAPGQVVEVYSNLTGPFEGDGYFGDSLSWYGPSRFDVQIAQDERPEMIIQEIEREMIGAGPNQFNALQLGDAVLDYATALSRRIGGTTAAGI